MFECTYSKCPKTKKKKKWLDGFIKSVKGKVSLYDENKKNIFSSKTYYIDSEESMKMGIFTIVVDDYTFLQGGKNESIDENITSLNEELDEIKQAPVRDFSTGGRSFPTAGEKIREMTEGEYLEAKKMKKEEWSKGIPQKEKSAERILGRSNEEILDIIHRRK